MNHQLSLLPSPEGKPFTWLRECLDAAYPVGKPERRVEFCWDSTRAKARDYPTTNLPPQLEVSRSAVLYERRAHERSKMSVYRSATLHWQDRQALCLIRDVSSSGMMCRTIAKLAEGDRVEVEMRSGDHIPGSVIWTKDGQLGIGFDQQVDVAALLNPRTPGDGPVQRMPRLSAACPATLIVKDARQNATLLDLSQGGAKIEATSLEVGDEVTLVITGLESRRGAVRWAQEGRAGIAFHNPISFDSLAHWAMERPGDQRVGTGSAPE